MVKITNKFGDVKKGKQHTVVYQGHYGNQTRRMLKKEKDEHTRGQLEQRERFKTGIDFAKNLTKAQRDFIKTYMAEAGIRSPDGLPTTWYSFAKKIAMTRPKVEMETEAEGNFGENYGDWNYRKPITLTNNSGSALSNHQQLITLTTSNFDYSKCKNDGGDIRFAASNGTAPLPYRIEDWNYNGTSTIWVKVDNIPTGENVCLYLYYGNAAATDESNGDNVFTAFLDQEEGNLSDWDETQGNVSASTDHPFQGSYGLKEVGSANPCNVIKSVSISGKRYIIWMYDTMSTTAEFLSVLRVGGSDGNVGVGIYTGKSTTNYIYHDKSYTYFTTSISRSSGWHKLEIKPTGSNVDLYIDGSKVATVTKPTETTNLNVAGHTAGIGYFDECYICKYVDPEPTQNLGSEETESEQTKLKTIEVHHPAIKTIGYDDVILVDNISILSEDKNCINAYCRRNDLDVIADKIKVKTLANQEYEFIVK